MSRFVMVHCVNVILRNLSPCAFSCVIAFLQDEEEEIKLEINVLKKVNLFSLLVC